MYQIVSNVPGMEFDIRRPYVGLDAVDMFLDSLQDDLNKYMSVLYGMMKTKGTFKMLHTVMYAKRS